jgi:hypothetical protein
MEKIFDFVSYFIIHTGVFLQNHEFNKIWMHYATKTQNNDILSS